MKQLQQIGMQAHTAVASGLNASNKLRTAYHLPPLQPFLPPSLPPSLPPWQPHSSYLMLHPSRRPTCYDRTQCNCDEGCCDLGNQLQARYTPLALITHSKLALHTHDKRERRPLSVWRERGKGPELCKIVYVEQMSMLGWRNSGEQRAKFTSERRQTEQRARKSRVSKDPQVERCLPDAAPSKASVSGLSWSSASHFGSLKSSSSAIRITSIPIMSNFCKHDTQ